MSKILVTGCAGFIGSHLTEKLLSLKHTVIGIDNFDTFYAESIKRNNIKIALEDKGFTLYENDILKIDALNDIFSSHSIDVVIHLAALAGVRNSFEDPERYFRVNTEGTRNIFEVALKHQVNQFIYASSSSVYGEMKGKKAIEDVTPLNPISPYAQSKVDAEVLIRKLQSEHGFDVNILRFFTVYGPRQRPDMAFQKFRRQILAGECIELYGEEMSRDFTPIDKILNGILASLNYKNGTEIFNLGSGKRVLVKDMILEIGEELGIIPQIKIVEKQKGDPSFTLADLVKVKKYLKY